MTRGKIVAIITGAISILIAVAYLVFVQILDMRGEMLPAPTGLFVLSHWSAVIRDLLMVNEAMYNFAQTL